MSLHFKGILLFILLIDILHIYLLESYIYWYTVLYKMINDINRLIYKHEIIIGISTLINIRYNK